MSMTLEQYLASLKGKTVAVIGIGISNTPLIKLLLHAGISVTACDKRNCEEFGAQAEELEALGARLKLGQNYLEGLEQNVIFRTPGLRPDVPELLLAQEKGSIITSEMEAFFQVCPCHTIGVTGSDGKTTTTTIIASLLKAAGYHTFVGGNIGRPLLADAEKMQPDDWAVLELSSFQLMTMDISPEIAIVTNLAPNHLDVHKSMAEYTAAKKNVFAHQSAGQTAIFNYDNEITREFSNEAPGRTVFFSRKQELSDGIFVKDGSIWTVGEQGEREVLPLGDILLPGEHNIENYLAAVAAVNGLVQDELIRTFASEFGGVEHRIELVRTRKGVRYYNDSIASSPSRTIAGLRSFREKVILIAGGYDKHIPFDVLGPEIVSHVKELVLTGDTADRIEAAVQNCSEYRGMPPITKRSDFQEAVLTAHHLAQPGDVVILSPACASFDRFKNFAQRGEAFKKIINEL